MKHECKGEQFIDFALAVTGRCGLWLARRGWCGPLVQDLPDPLGLLPIAGLALAFPGSGAGDRLRVAGLSVCRSVGSPFWDP